MAKLENKANSGSVSVGEDYFAIRDIPVYDSAEGSEPVGNLTLGAAVEILDESGDRVQVALKAWRKDKGFGRVIFDEFGHNIRVAVLSKDTAQKRRAGHGFRSSD